MKFGCSICTFLSSANLICRGTDISKCFRGSLRLRDNESVDCIFLGKRGYFEMSVLEISREDQFTLSSNASGYDVAVKRLQDLVTNTEPH